MDGWIAALWLFGSSLRSWFGLLAVRAFLMAASYRCHCMEGSGGECRTPWLE